MPSWPIELGPYFWLLIAIVLAGAELAMPGFFLLWLGVAAGLTGIIHLVMPMSLAIETLIFILASATLIAATWRMVSQSWNAKSDSPHLNQRQGAFIGQVFTLHVAIQNGRGKIVAEDVLWDVEGLDQEKGSKVKVTGVSGMRLTVQKA